MNCSKSAAVEERRLLPKIHGSLRGAEVPSPFESLEKLVSHNSMSVYYDIRFGPDGEFFIEELATTTARAELLRSTFDQLLAEHGARASVLDLACSPGYFMFKMAAAGFRNIKGVDVRPEHQAQFRFLQGEYGFAGLEFELSDMYDFLDREISSGRTYDICLLFGFLYHTSMPVELLKKIRMICGKCLILDTTLNDDNRATLNIYEENVAWSRASSEKVSFMPSLQAVPKLVEAAGFSRCDRIIPDPGLIGQNPGGDNIDYYFDLRTTPPPALRERILRRLTGAGNGRAVTHGQRRAFFCVYP